MKTPVFAFVESNTTGTGRLFARAASGQGWRPMMLTADPARYRYVEEDGLGFIQVDTSDKELLFETCQRLAVEQGLVGVASSSEYFVGTAAAIARRLKLPGPSPRAIEACRDKWMQRSRLRSAGVPVPDFGWGECVATATCVAKHLGFPVVVKPVNGSGSCGVKLCENEEALSRHAEALFLQPENERGLPSARRILIEKLVAGPEYSVETMAGKVVGITRKYLGALPNFVEMGHDYPAPLPPEPIAAISQIALGALKALDLEWGPTHIELRLTQAGPTIIEVNPRLAGGYIPELVKLASGINLIAETIKQAAGQRPALERIFDHYASIRFLVPKEEGILIGIDGVDAARQVPGLVEALLYRRVGEPVKLYGDFRDRVGHVIALADTSRGAAEAAAQARAIIRLTVRSSYHAKAQR